MKTVACAPVHPAASLRHIPALDGLRGVAIVLVLTGHTLHFSLRLPGSYESLGSAGVTLFFALSGFLITGLLCKEESQRGSIHVWSFYRDRALRIFPAYYVLLAGTTILMLAGNVTDVPWISVAVCSLFLRNIFGRGDTLTHSWTLSMEQQFYALWPLAILRIRCRAMLPWAIGATVGITLWRTTAITAKLWNYENGWFYMRPDFRFDSILVGCCIALALYAPKTNDSQAGKSRRLRLHKLARFASPAWVFPAFIFWTLKAAPSIELRPYYTTVQMTIASLLLLNVLLCQDTRWAKGLSSSCLKLFGRLSYSIYLWQQVFLVTKFPDWGWIRVFPFDLIMACGAGTASYYLIELPFLKWKAKLRDEAAAPTS